MKLEKEDKKFAISICFVIIIPISMFLWAVTQSHKEENICKKRKCPPGLHAIIVHKTGCLCVQEPLP